MCVCVCMWGGGGWVMKGLGDCVDQQHLAMHTDWQATWVIITVTCAKTNHGVPE